MSRLIPDRFVIMLVTAVLVASFLPISGQAADWWDVATDLAIALLFFLHGARLSRDVVIAGVLHWRLHLVVLCFTYVAFPLVGMALLHVLPFELPSGFITGLLFVCVLPSTVQSSIAFTSIAGGNVPAAICSASLSNILGMFITPLLTGLILSTSSVGGGTGFSFDVLQSILLQLLLPFILGQVAQPWIGAWVRAHKKILSPVDRGSIIMVVYGAFSSAVIGGLWHRVDVHQFILLVITCAVLLAIILILTINSGRLLGFSREDSIVITFCGSKKSLASGVPMAGAIFAGHSIGAIVLPIMIFHQIQIATCAFIAQHYAAKAKAAEAKENAA